MVNRIAALIVAVVVGFGFGFWFNQKLVQADRTEVAEATTKAAIKEAGESSEKSNEIEVAVTANNARQAVIKDRIVERIVYKKAEYEKAECPAFAFDSDTIGLLNAARQNTDPAATGSNAEGPAFAAVGIAEFVANDLEVVRLYHELALRHDQLVDYVQSKMNKQAE